VLKKSFRGEIFFYFIIVFILFTVAVLAFQYQREKKYRTSQLDNTLDNITELIYRYIEQNDLIASGQIGQIKEIEALIPQPNTRITIISKKGLVIYDSFVEDYQTMENHSNRPEIRKALHHKTGSNIRRSETTNQEYYYYAKNYPGYFIRTAVVYNIQIKNFLEAEKIYIFFIIAVFAVIGIVLYFVTGRMSESITRLKDFSIQAGKNELAELNVPFPENELGIIGSQIARIYNNLKKATDSLTNEKEKLLNHLNALNEGIAFFSPEKEITLSNSHFVQYINYISKKSIHSDQQIFAFKEFRKLSNFLKKHLDPDQPIKVNALPQLEFIVAKGEKFFKIKSIVFPDKSFEVIVSDITKLEKRRLLKQQLTSNIAHELKTPLASIKGYLETILGNWPVPETRLKHFLRKAFGQAERLTDLINDVSLLNNIEDAGDLFTFKPTDVREIIDEVHENFANRMEVKKIHFVNDVKKGTVINGNGSLLFSIFQNLIENSINYGGKGIKISVTVYHEDEKYYYFLLTDSGPGIPEEHLARVFERFYRIDHGRTRKTGGTGLGLAIVKNAVQLHKGEISVKNNVKGGTVFLFSLAKK